MATPTQINRGGQISGTVLFYNKPEPLSPELHKTMGVKRLDGPFGFARTGHAVPLTVTEFSIACLTFPIIFVGEDKTPLAVMGLNAEQNMFLRDDGLFDPGIYVPAYVRRYPFVFANDDAAQQSILCIDRSAEFVVEGGDLPFFNEDGSPSEYTQNCIEFCNNYEIERQKTLAFVQILKDLESSTPCRMTSWRSCETMGRCSRSTPTWSACLAGTGWWPCRSTRPPRPRPVRPACRSNARRPSGSGRKRPGGPLRPAGHAGR